jgi:benzoylformate decarboxylase
MVITCPPTPSCGAVTSDPDEAARTPVGHILLGDPADAIKRLADAIPGARRPPLPAREPLPRADTTGPAFTKEAILDAVKRREDRQHGHRPRVDLDHGLRVGLARAHPAGSQ